MGFTGPGATSSASRRRTDRSPPSSPLGNSIHGAQRRARATTELTRSGDSKILVSVPLSQFRPNDYRYDDTAPSGTPHADPLELMLPEGLNDRSSDQLIRNHFWEHLPGTWMDYVDSFLRPGAT